MRQRCSTIAPRNTSAAQWWIWRMTQPGAHVEAQVHDRSVGLRHVHAAQRCVRAVVDDVLRARVEEEREVHAGDDEDHEAVEGDLAEHERPVVGEDLVEGLAREARAAEAVVEPAHQAVQHHVGPSRIEVDAGTRMRAARAGRSQRDVITTPPMHGRKTAVGPHHDAGELLVGRARGGPRRRTRRTTACERASSRRRAPSPEA